MRALYTALLAAAFILAGTQAGLAAATLQNGEMTYESGGKKTVFTGDDAAVQKIKGSDLVFLTLDEDPAKRIGKKPTLFVFDASGALAAETSAIPDVDIEQISALSLSPKGGVLAVDNGTWVVRSWSFVSYPALTPAGKPVAYLTDEDLQDLVWVNDDAVLVTVINENSGRKCADYDPCGPRSVVLHRISTGKTTPVLAGTDVCDYGLTGFDGKSVTAIKTCGKTAKDWASADSKEKGLTRSKENAPLPDKF